MFVQTSIAILLALGVQGSWAQCPTITSQVTYGADTQAQVSAGTRATVLGPGGRLQSITILPCAEATVGGKATVVVRGGTASVSGGTLGYATATFYGTVGAMPVATSAYITVGGSASLSISAGREIQIQAGYAATITASGKYVSVNAEGGDNRVVMDADGGRLAIGGDGSEADFTFKGETTEGSYANVYDNARAALRGDTYGSSARDGGRADIYGSAIACTAMDSGTCSAMASYQTLMADVDGYVEATVGSSNIVAVSESGSGRVGGAGNTGVVASGGRLEIVNTGRAFVESGAEATVYEGVSEVTVSAFGTATMYAGATVTAQSNADLRVGQFTQLNVIRAQDDGTTVYEARAMDQPTGARAEERRAKRAQATGRCSTGSELCPNLRGVFSCVPVDTDIFNCGGCALASGSGRDCTQVYDGAVSCVLGQCVSL